jgi:hypothetical protein
MRRNATSCGMVRKPDNFPRFTSGAPRRLHFLTTPVPGLAPLPMAEFAATSNNSPENAGNWERAMNDPDSLSFEERSALRGVMYKIFQLRAIRSLFCLGRGLFQRKPSDRRRAVPMRRRGRAASASRQEIYR